MKEFSKEELERQKHAGLAAIIACSFTKYVLREGLRCAEKIIQPKQLSKSGYWKARKRDFRILKQKTQSKTNYLEFEADIKESPPTYEPQTQTIYKYENLQELKYDSLLYSETFDQRVFTNVIMFLSELKPERMTHSKLVSVNLCGQNIGNDGLRKLIHGLQVSPQSITSLVLSNNKIDDEGMKEFASTIALLSSLRELYLNGNFITDVGIECNFNDVTYPPSLEVLNLARNPVGVTTAFNLGMMFCKDRNSKLHSVYLGDKMGLQGLGDDFIRVFAALVTTPGARPLRRLAIPNGGLSDTGMMAIAVLVLCATELTELNITGNAVMSPLTKYSLKLAVEINNSLQSVHLQNCGLTGCELLDFAKRARRRDVKLSWPARTFLSRIALEQLSLCDQRRMEEEDRVVNSIRRPARRPKPVMPTRFLRGHMKPLLTRNRFQEEMSMEHDNYQVAFTPAAICRFHPIYTPVMNPPAVESSEFVSADLDEMILSIDDDDVDGASDTKTVSSRLSILLPDTISMPTLTQQSKDVVAAKGISMKLLRAKSNRGSFLSRRSIFVDSSGTSTRGSFQSGPLAVSTRSSVSNRLLSFQGGGGVGELQSSQKQLQSLSTTISAAVASGAQGSALRVVTMANRGEKRGSLAAAAAARRESMKQMIERRRTLSIRPKAVGSLSSQDASLGTFGSSPRVFATLDGRQHKSGTQEATTFLPRHFDSEAISQLSTALKRTSIAIRRTSALSASGNELTPVAARREDRDRNGRLVPASPLVDIAHMSSEIRGSSSIHRQESKQSESSEGDRRTSVSSKRSSIIFNSPSYALFMPQQRTLQSLPGTARAAEASSNSQARPVVPFPSVGVILQSLDLPHTDPAKRSELIRAATLAPPDCMNSEELSVMMSFVSESLAACDSLLPWLKSLEELAMDTMVNTVVDLSLDPGEKVAIRQTKNLSNACKRRNKEIRALMSIVLNKLSSQVRAKIAAAEMDIAVVKKDSMDNYVSFDMALMAIEDYMATMMELSFPFEKGIAIAHKFRLSRSQDPLEFEVPLVVAPAASESTIEEGNKPVTANDPNAKTEAPKPVATARYVHWMPYSNALGEASFFSHLFFSVKPFIDREKAEAEKLLKLAVVEAKIKGATLKLTSAERKERTRKRALVYAEKLGKEASVQSPDVPLSTSQPQQEQRPKQVDMLKRTDMLNHSSRRFPALSHSKSARLEPLIEANDLSPTADTDVELDVRKNPKPVPGWLSSRAPYRRLTPPDPQREQEASAFDEFFSGQGRDMATQLAAAVKPLGETEPLQALMHAQQHLVPASTLGLRSVYTRHDLIPDDTDEDSDNFQLLGKGRRDRRYFINRFSNEHPDVLLEQEEDRGKPLPLTMKLNYFRRDIRREKRFDSEMKLRKVYYKSCDVEDMRTGDIRS